MLLLTDCGKNLNIYEVTKLSTFLVGINCNPLLLGESKSEKDATTFFIKVCDLIAVSEATTTLTRVSYPGYLVFSSIDSIACCSVVVN